MKIEIKSHFSDWKEVDRETEIKYILNLHFPNIKDEQHIEYINKNKLRGITVLELCPNYWEIKKRNVGEINKKK